VNASDPHDPRRDRDPREPVDHPPRDEPWNDPDESPLDQPPVEDPPDAPAVDEPARRDPDPKEPPRQAGKASPLDVEGVDLELTAEEIVAVVRERRAREDS
jgi:hypothetical protein